MFQVEAQLEMTEITTSVHQVDGVNANSFLVLQSDGSLTLIDTGMGKDGRKILEYIQEKMSKKPSEIRTIILTHAHIDHVRGAFELRRATGAKLAIHEHDFEYLSGKKKMPPPKGAVGFLFKILGTFFKFTPVEADEKLKENDKIGSLTIVHTPGHTPGSMSLYDKERKIIFVGDTIRYSKGKIEGPPKQFTQDMSQAAGSIRKISSLDFEVLLGGHGEPLKSDASGKVKELSSSFATRS